MFNALSLVKVAVSGVVGIGAGKIVGGIVKDHVDPKTLFDKVAISGATWVIGAMAGKATKDATNDMIDETYNGIVDGIKEFKVSQKLNRINAKTSTFEKEGLNESDFALNVTNNKWEPKKPADDKTSAI